MSKAVNIGTMPIADKVQRHMNARYYVRQLETLKTEAEAIGYFFAPAPTATVMTPQIIDYLAQRVAYQRRTLLYPRESFVEWLRDSDQELKSGYAQELLQEMLIALAALGLYLQEKPEAHALWSLTKQTLEDIPT